MKPDGMGIYMEDTEDERPLFNFGLRPWKVETSIRTNKACYEKQYGKARFASCQFLIMTFIFIPIA